MTSNELKDERERLEIEMRSAILNGAADRLIRIDGQLKQLQIQIVAREIQELRENLDAIDRRKVELQNEVTALENIRGERNKDLAQSIKAMQEKQLVVRKVELALASADAERKNLLESRRELKEKLGKIAREQLKSAGINSDERFETIY